MIHDEVLFTPQLATVVMDLRRRISQVATLRMGVSCLAFCLLASIRSHGGSMTLASFPRHALGSDNTVVVAAGSLARAQLVEKRRETEDARIVTLAETERGAMLLESSFDALYDNLRTTVWSGHADEDIFDIMSAFSTVADKLGIGRVEINRSCHPIITPAYIMILLALVRRWEEVVRLFSGLSFTEYRCLALLETRPTPMVGAAIAEGLMLDRSTVSAIVSKLSTRKLVSVLPGEDRRNRNIALTDRGEVFTALVTVKLGKTTAELYSDVEASLKAKTNELHMRMHATYATGSHF